MSWFGVVSYGAAAVVYGLLAAILIASQPRAWQPAVLTATTVASAVWAGTTVVLLISNDEPPLYALLGLDALHLLMWCVAVLTWLVSRSTGRWLLVLACACGLWVPLAAAPFVLDGALSWTAYPAIVAMAFLGFLAAEQVLRNAEDDQRRRLRMLCGAAGGIFTIDLFVYSQASLIGGLLPGFWELRGLANAALAPLVVLAIKRQPEWERELFVSRQVVFYTASLLGVGVYLLAMGLLAYVIRALGGEWSLLLEVVFLVAAVGLFVYVFFSAPLRARLKVLVVKHFYPNKYDYREEWLQLTQRLGETSDPQSLTANALEALAGIVESKQGDLWLSRDGQSFELVASLAEPVMEGKPLDDGHKIVRFLRTSGWVIDSEEYARQPDRYGTSFGDPAHAVLPDNSLIVPLDCLGHLQGYAVLRKPAGLRALNFEDHDILKTAGRQIAVVLAQVLAQEQLAETRQFEAMNKLSTFLMHDLKNVVAQQELVVANAQRFRHRPEFIDDAFATIKSSVDRIKRLLEQLRSATSAESAQGRVDVSKVLMEVRSQCADRQPVPEIELNTPAAWVGMDRDKLTAVLTHLVRNSQDATAPDGRIKIAVETSDERLIITVADTGCGMDAGFLRDRLFRPFDSTKGAKGMGIGAYQVRHLTRAAGGDVEVQSQPGVGTTFRLRLPAVSA